jgi:hypothetical protein
MDAKILQRVMDLADRTGDRVIVVNPENGTAHAVVPFDAYEKLVSGQASLKDLSDESVSDEIETTENEATDEEFSRLVEEIEKEAVTEAVATRIEETKPVIIKTEEINEKIAEESQKMSTATPPIDIIDNEANEEEYYLEPLE